MVTETQNLKLTNSKYFLAILLSVLIMACTGTKRTEKAVADTLELSGDSQLKQRSDLRSVRQQDTSTVNIPSFKTADGLSTVGITNDSCLIITDAKTGKPTFDKCFENIIIQFRPMKGNVLPLTFISGKHYMDIDFRPEGGEWVASEVMIFNPAKDGEKGALKKVHVVLSDFDYSSIAEGE
ncbi:hypothetical protein PBAL39_19030 [Pedobacter sp. BAL39]|uniref:hypothetical protein n=1 Tax=Pedobacter sp. BAL39 TaxID=391596 RepID=UPI000155AA18|nr:hypothetical protein [Pedobacter sp. BAL39]EDM34415.1 hypothetical protein PBAL39_19030 [Pedobacter sp. BAL39]